MAAAGQDKGDILMLPRLDRHERRALWVMGSLWACAIAFIALGALLALGSP